MNRKSKIPSEYLTRLKIISQFLKQMRFIDGKTQDGYGDLGLSRRQIQHCESGCNISLVKLFSILDAYGYSFNDIVDID